jgi:type IV secretory pathway VirB2 component (pilin)
MIRDPFGGWDWDGIKQLSMSFLFLFGVISLFSHLGGDAWYGPYTWILGVISGNAEISIAIAMILLMGLWWHEQFNGGYY